MKRIDVIKHEQSNVILVNGNGFIEILNLNGESLHLRDDIQIGGASTLKFTKDQDYVFYISVIGDKDTTKEIELVSFNLSTKVVEKVSKPYLLEKSIPLSMHLENETELSAILDYHFV